MRFLLLLLLFSCASIQREEETEFLISSDVYDTFRVPFRSFPNSLEMVVPQEPVKSFFVEWSQDHPDVTPPELYSIPVVSPREMERLKKFIKKEEIEKFAKESFLQNSRFNVICIGQTETTAGLDYFIVLESEELTKIRLEILEIFRIRGGDRKDFFATAYTPILPLKKSPTANDFVTEKGSEDCTESIRASEPYDGKGPNLVTDPVI